MKVTKLNKTQREQKCPRFLLNERKERELEMRAQKNGTLIFELIDRFVFNSVRILVASAFCVGLLCMAGFFMDPEENYEILLSTVSNSTQNELISAAEVFNKTFLTVGCMIVVGLAYINPSLARYGDVPSTWKSYAKHILTSLFATILLITLPWSMQIRIAGIGIVGLVWVVIRESFKPVNKGNVTRQEDNERTSMGLLSPLPNVIISDPKNELMGSEKNQINT